MTNSIKKTTDHEGNIRCVKCGKLLAKKFTHGHFEIKCPRCDMLSLVFEKMINQVIVTNPEGKILYINRATEMATGYNINEAIGHKVSDLWGGHMSKKFYEKLWKKIKKEKKTAKVSLVNKTKTGRMYEVELSISPILNTRGSVMFYVGIEMSVKKRA